MGKVISPIEMIGSLHQDLWEVLHVSNPVCHDFRIGDMGRNTLHPAGVEEPA